MAALVCLSACSKAPVRSVEVAALNDLSATGEYQWANVAVCEGLKASAEGTAVAVRCGDGDGEADTQLRGTVETVGGQARFRWQAFSQKTQQERGRSEWMPVNDAATLAGLVTSAARLTGAPWNSLSDGTLRAAVLYAKAATGAPAQRAALLDEARRTDPSFGATYLALALEALQQRDTARVKLLAQEAQASGVKPAVLGQLQTLAGGVSGDEALQLAGLAKLAQDKAATAETKVRYGQALILHREPAKAAEQFAAAAQLAPGNGQIWKQLAYAESFAGNQEGALKAAEAYRRVSPQDPDTVDTRGEILYRAGKRAEGAALIEQSAKQAPKANGGLGWRRAAVAWWMAGDRAKAEAAEKQFEAVQVGDPRETLWKSQWLMLTGRAAEGASILKAARDRNPQQLLPMAVLQEVVILEATGQREAAAELLAKARALDKTPAQVWFRICVALSQPAGSKAEWEERAKQVFAKEEEARWRGATVGLGLLADGKTAEGAMRLRSALPEMGISVGAFDALAEYGAGKKMVAWLPVGGNDEIFLAFMR